MKTTTAVPISLAAQYTVDDSIIDLNKSEADLNRCDLAMRSVELDQITEQKVFEASQDYRHGVVAFTAEIDVGPVMSLSGTLRRLARLRPGKPLRIELNSNGGTIVHGFQLIDDIAVIGKDNPITIAVRGQACSMAAVVFQAAQTRLIGPNAYLMLHRASFGVGGSADEVEDSVEEVRMFEKRIYEIVAKRSKKTVEFWKKQLGRRKDVWYSAEEAVKIGLADAIG